jgi:hypothetical protein
VGEARTARRREIAATKVELPRAFELIDASGKELPAVEDAGDSD